MSIYLSKRKNIVLIIREIYIINNLSINLLIEIDVFKLKDIVFNLSRDVLIINSYNNFEIFILIYIKFIRVDIIIFSKIRKIIISCININNFYLCSS